MVVPVLDSWPRESNNSIVFVSKPDKYMLLKRPQVGDAVSKLTMVPRQPQETNLEVSFSVSDRTRLCIHV